MGNVGLISAVGIGVIASLSAPVLVWALVVAGLRRVANESALAAGQPGVKTSRGDA